MTIGAMLAEMKKLRSSLPSDSDSPTSRRLAFARDLYGEGHPALARLAEKPDDLAAILEFRLDQFLASPKSLARCGGGTAAIREFLDCPERFTLRRLEIDPDAPEPMQAPASPGSGLVIPHSDERYAPDVKRRGGPSRSIWLPLGSPGPPLLIYDARPPESLEECLWLAGQDDGLYLALVEAEDGDDDERATLANTEGQAMTLAEFLGADDMVRLAIRSEDGLVSTRAFGEVWKAVGTIEKG